MQVTETTARLTDAAVMAMLAAAAEKARSMGQPQCIVIVDASAVEVGSLRMTGARVLSLRSARAKAMTAASTGRASAALAEGVRLAIAAATDGSARRSADLEGWRPAGRDRHRVGQRRAG